MVYNKSPGHLNNIQVISHDLAMISAGSLPTHEIHRTTHWIWFCDPTWYGSNRQYVDPFLDWPETCYLKIAEWLSLVLPPGGFDGGRRGVYVDPAPGFWAWTAGGNIGMGRDVFVSLPSWADVVIPHETTNMFTGEGVCAGWPEDWWANSRSPFPAMVAVKVEAFYNKPYWQQHDADDSTDPTYVMFKNLQVTYGWRLFQEVFKEMNEKNVDLSQVRSEFEDPNWLSKGYLRSHYVAYYLSRKAGTDLSSTLNSATVGKKPPNWPSTRPFYEYAINVASVLPVASIQSPVGWQRGTITLSATASDMDQHVVDVTFWYSRDRATFYWIGIYQVESDGWSVQWNTTNPIPDMDESVWVMCVSHDTNGFESEWSVSDQFGVDNRPQLSVDLVSPSDGSTVYSSPTTLKSRVTSGNAVPDVTVRFYVGGALAGSTTTNSEGYASIQYPSSGNLQTGVTYSWYTTVEKTGYAPKTSSTWTFQYSASGERGSTRIVLDASPKSGYVNKLVTIFGTLYGSWRRIRGVVVGASVEITTDWGLRMSAVTNDQGQFSVTTNCPSAGGTYTITATFYEDQDLSGSSASIQYQVVAKIETTLSLSCVRISYGMGLAAKFYGFLTEKSSGAPVAGKTIHLTVFGGGSGWTYAVTTNSAGYYELVYTNNGGMFNWAEASFSGDDPYLPSSSGRIYG